MVWFKASDAGVKAAATNIMAVLTDLPGEYDYDLRRFVHPSGNHWQDVAKKNKVKFNVKGSIDIGGEVNYHIYCNQAAPLSKAPEPDIHCDDEDASQSWSKAFARLKKASNLNNNNQELHEDEHSDEGECLYDRLIEEVLEEREPKKKKLSLFSRRRGNSYNAQPKDRHLTAMRKTNVKRGELFDTFLCNNLYDSDSEKNISSGRDESDSDSESNSEEVPSLEF